MVYTFYRSYTFHSGLQLFNLFLDFLKIELQYCKCILYSPLLTLIPTVSIWSLIPTAVLPKMLQSFAPFLAQPPVGFSSCFLDKKRGVWVSHSLAAKTPDFESFFYPLKKLRSLHNIYQV